MPTKIVRYDEKQIPSVLGSEILEVSFYKEVFPVP